MHSSWWGSQQNLQRRTFNKYLDYSILLPHLLTKYAPPRAPAKRRLERRLKRRLIPTNFTPKKKRKCRETPSYRYSRAPAPLHWTKRASFLWWPAICPHFFFSRGTHVNAVPSTKYLLIRRARACLKPNQVRFFARPPQGYLIND